MCVRALWRGVGIDIWPHGVWAKGKRKQRGAHTRDGREKSWRVLEWVDFGGLQGLMIRDGVYP